MEKSLLDIVQPMQKYNFSAYRKESYKHLPFLLDRVREKAQHLCEESVTSGEDEKGCPFVTFQSEEVIADIQRYDSEIKYLERLIRIRRFWRPRDWLNAICNEFDYLKERLSHHRDMRHRKRIEAMTPEKRTRYYRKRVRSLEKKILAIYATYAPEISSDCSFVAAHALITPKELRCRLESLLSERSHILDQMFRATPAEVARLMISTKAFVNTYATWSGNSPRSTWLMWNVLEAKTYTRCTKPNSLHIRSSPKRLRERISMALTSTKFLK